MLLLVDEVGLHVKDVAVHFADLLHLLDHVLGLDVTTLLKRKVCPAVVSRAPCKAANALGRQDFFRAHRCNHVSVKMLWDLVVDLLPKFLLRHPPGVLDPYPRQLRVKFRR